MAGQGLVVKVPIRAFPIGILVLSVCVVLLPLGSPRVAGAQDSNLEELFRQAQAASAAKDYAGAEALYRRILRADPTLLPARVNLGLACYWQHKHRKAVTEFQKALRVSPKEFSALLFSGLAYLDLGEYDRAEVQLQAAARVQDMDPLLFWALGSLAMIHGDANAAVPLLERSLALDANNVRAVWLLGQAYARLAYRRGEKPIVPADYASLTAQTLRWIEERQPDSALLHVFKGDVLVARKLTSEALAEYQKALEIDPHWPDIHLLMANLLGLRGRWDEALQHLKLQLQDFPDDTRALVEMGSVYCRAGNYQAALPILAQAVTRDRDNYEANFRLGQARVTLGMFELAVPPLERATRVNPERSDPFYLLYRAYRALKQPEKASSALAQFKARKAAGPPPEAEQ